VLDSRIDRSKATLAHQVEEQLRRQIVRGDRPIGSRLNEAEIAASLDVSRGPVREALQRLARDGLVVIEPHRGASVRSLNRDELVELFAVRIALESEAAGIAAERIRDDEVKALNHMQLQSVTAVAIEGDGSFPDVIDLHEFIANVAANTRLAVAVQQVNQELRLVRSRSGASAQRAEEALREHQALVDALQMRDSDQARLCMRQHLNASLANTLAMMFSDSTTS
jgi:DNA-binding GntR family transcriptional regulator